MYSEEGVVFSQKKNSCLLVQIYRKIFTTHEKSIKIASKIKESGAKSEGILVLIPSDENM
jgi:hypothetical protein